MPDIRAVTGTVYAAATVQGAGVVDPFGSRPIADDLNASGIDGPIV